MIEMLGVLAIIGVLSVGGIAGYSKAMMKFKTNKTIDQIAMTITNIRTLYAQQNSYDITDANAYAMGVVDDAMKTAASGKSLKNAFNGFVKIGTGKSGAVGESGDGAFIVTFGGLPREACVAIATNDWGSNYSSGLLGIGATANDTAAVYEPECGVNGTSVTLKTGNTTIGDSKLCVSSTNPVFTVATAAAGCNCSNSTNSKNNCIVSLKYY